jgi:plastocyanin
MPLTLRSRVVLAVVLSGALVATAVLVGAPAQARHRRHRHRTINVIDDQFVRPRIHVHPGTTIVWKWSSQNVNSHDVKLTKGPGHVKHFHSRTATQNFTFRRTLRKRGRYRYRCTFHVGMRGVIAVRR